MTTLAPTVLELTEYQTASLPAGELDVALGERLWREYGKYVSVEPPGFKTNYQWQLTPQGYVGYIPLTPDMHIAIRPKVPVENIFRMLEYAYNVPFQQSGEMVNCEALEDYFERLATVLAKRVLDRGRKGFYRAYIAESDRLPYLRGQLDVHRLMCRPWDTDLHCHYEEHTGDLVENQILAWTLHTIIRSGLCSEKTLPTVRHAYRTMQGLVTLTPFNARACVGRLYNRLNDDYEPLHALCRFFLEHSGPHFESGERTMIPFLIDMALLFERFVAEWLRMHLPKSVRLKVQEDVDLTEAGDLKFRIDLVLYDAKSSDPVMVLDTKYKAPEAPSTDDVGKVTAYAVSKSCSEAALIFPAALSAPLNTLMGDKIRVRSLEFQLDGSLDQSGKALITQLL